MLLGGDGEPARTTRVQAPLDGSDAARRQAARARRRAAAPPRATTTVAVLNGTQTPGLASRISDELRGEGFQRGPVENASSQDRSVTVVSYRQGAERQAHDVARALNLPADAVMQIDAETESAACVNTTPCTATVVVTVGADKQPQ
jgi:aromatic ring hydroxylase